MKADFLETLMHTHQANLYRYLRYLGAERSLAEDLVQETFLAAYNARSRPLDTEQRRIASWLRAIARNLFYSHCRKEKRNPIAANPTWLEQAEAIWEEETNGNGLEPHIQALRKCLHEINDRNRQILELRYGGNVRVQDVGQQLSLSEEAVKSALRRVKEFLRKCVRGRLARENAL